MKGRNGYGMYKKRKLRKWENDGKQNSHLVSPDDRTTAGQLLLAM